jgi:hypothetical protein
MGSIPATCGGVVYLLLFIGIFPSIRETLFLDTKTVNNVCIIRMILNVLMVYI